MLMRSIRLALAAFGVTVLSCQPGSAQAIRFDPAMNAASPLLSEVQFRGGGRPHHRPGGGMHRPGGRPGFRPGGRPGFRPGGRPGFRPGGGYHGGYGYRRGRGAAIGAGVAGLAAGAIIGGALASQPPVYAAPPPGDDVAYCARRYRSYDPRSGTYLGYDGLRHPCP